MPNIVEIIIDGKNQGAIKAINGVSNELIKTERTSRSLSDRLGSMFSSGAVALAASGLLTSFAYAIKQQIDLADNLSKTAQRIGISTEQLSTLRYVADLSDVSFENLSTAVQRLSKNLFDVSNNVGQTAKYGFDALGISVTDSDGKLKDSSQVLLDIADKFSRMKDGTEKTAVAVTLFGRSGAQMIPMLNEGGKGIEKLQEKARDLGLELSTNAGRQAEQFNDNLTLMKNASTGLANQLMISLLPTLLQVEDSLISLIGNTSRFSPILDSIASVFKLIVSAEYVAMTGAKSVVDALKTLALVAVKFINHDFSGAYNELIKGGKEVGDNYVNLFSLLGNLWSDTSKYDEKTKKLLKDLELQKQQQATIQLQKQWDSVSTTLKRNVMLEGLGPLSKAQMNLIFKVEDLKNKYGKVKGAIAEINNYYTEIINKQLQLTAAATSFRSADMFGGLNNLNKPQKIEMQPVGMEALDAAHKKQLAMISELTTAEQLSYMIRQGSAQEAFGNMAQMADSFYQASGQKSKELFVLNKAFSIGQAIMSTYQAASGALAMEPVGPWNFVLAASIVAAGLANVARIASTQPTTGAAGITTAAPPNISRTSNNTTNNSTTNNNTPTITVNINGPVTGDMDQFIRDTLIPGIKKAYGDGMG